MKTKYIPSYIFENEGKIFKKFLKNGSFFKKRKLPKLNGNFMMSYDIASEALNNFKKIHYMY